MARSLAARRAVRLGAAVAALVPAARGQSQEPPPATTVAVYAPPCIGRPFDRSTLGELLRVELRALGVTNVFVDSPDAPVTSVKEAPLAVVVVSPQTCEPAAKEVTIRVVDRTIPKSLERRMTISDIDVAERPRTLAIGIAELLAASFAELELAGAPKGLGVPPAVHAALIARLVPAADAAGRTAVRQVDARFDARAREAQSAAAEREAEERSPSVDVTGLARAFPARGTALLGGMIAGRFRVGRLVALHVGADLAGGDTDVPVGTVTVGAALGHVGAGVTTGGAVELEVGPGMEAGYGWAKGNSRDANTAGSSYGNVLVLANVGATLRVRGSSSWSALVGADFGYALSGVSFYSDASRAAGLGGVDIALRAGVGFVF